MSPHPVFRQFIAGVLVLLVATPAAAQHQIMLLHGFVSNGGAWGATADRLRTEFDAAVTAPDLDWRRPYMDQAVDADGRNLLATNHPVFVGHSNGGQVARHWSRIRVPEAVVTIGTPHQGAPLIPQFCNWDAFNESGINAINNVGESFTRANGYMWVLALVADRLDFLGRFSHWSVAYLAATLGLNQFAEVTGDMRPGSAALGLINGHENITRERTMIPNRVGIVSIAHNFFWAGPARAIDPDWADRLAVVMYGAAAFIAAWGTYLYVTAEPGDLDALDAALSMFNVVSFVMTIDPLYCTLVSSVNGTQCVANDGVVPYTSQEYPFAANIYLGGNNDGPTHTQETAQSDVIADVLRTYVNLPRRAPGTPAPPPPTDPSPEPQPTDVLYADQGLQAGDYRRSSDGRFTLSYQEDGNLVLYDAAWNPVWASHTATGEAGIVYLQTDGNFVIYDASGTAIWATGSNVPNARLLVQNDGNVVIYAPDGTAVWATGTRQ